MTKLYLAPKCTEASYHESKLLFLRSLHMIFLLMSYSFFAVLLVSFSVDISGYIVF